MKLNRLIILFFIINTNIAFGNIKVRITTGFQYEEIKKSWIIGELARRLSQKLHYTKQIFIDFKHHYIDNCDPNYFISYDNGNLITLPNTGEPHPPLKGNALVIREISRQFSASATLQILEYAILNAEKIKSTQKKIEINQRYPQYKLNSIDTNLVKKIATEKASKNVYSVLQQKTYRQNYRNDDSEISYYFQHNKYYVFYNYADKKEKVLLIVDNIYQFTGITNEKCVVFDSDSSFYYIAGGNYPRSSKRKIIKNIVGNYEPFKIGEVGAYKITVSFWYFDKTGNPSYGERNILYKTNDDEIIQDLDKVLAEQQH